MATTPMRISAAGATASVAEWTIYERLLPLDGARILDLGCGRAELTRKIAEKGSGRHVTALEVDAIQHGINAARRDLPNVEFKLAGAEAIPAPDAHFDVALMFKSLHHVPGGSLQQALREIRRVLKPGGLLYVSEPVFGGDFNEILRLFNDEQSVRAAAFAALQAAVADGSFELVEESFFDAPVKFQDFAEFERMILGVTHTQHVLSPEVLGEVRRRFARHASPDGVRLLQPMRIDLLRRPAAAH
jgi:SAM-dependent methyltransferase